MQQSRQSDGKQMQDNRQDFYDDNSWHHGYGWGGYGYGGRGPLSPRAW